MFRKDTVAIVNQELVPVLKSNRLTQLLQRPGGTRMRSDVTMDQASAAVLDHHKYVQQLKRRRDGDEEITRNEPLGVQAQERRPAHISSRPTRRTSQQVLVHRSERLEFPASAGVHWRCVPRPTWDSRSPSGGSGPESQAESAVGRVRTSTARIISIPLGANGSSSRGAPRPERPASERIVIGMPERAVRPNQFTAA